MENTSIWPIVCLVVAAVLALATFTYLVVPHSESVPANFADTVALKVVDKLPTPAPAAPATVVAYNDTALQNKVDKLSNEVLKADFKEEKAKELVISELVSRDFRSELRALLNDELEASNSSSTIENYKDIKSIQILDSDYTVTGDSATADLKLKVTYAADGDTDSSDFEKAQVKVSLEVEELNTEDEYVDAEVVAYDVDDFEFVKFY